VTPVLSTPSAAPAFRARLERFYRAYTRAEWVSTDPIQFVLACSNRKDQEVVGLLASSLAYGRVAQIQRSVERVLAPMEGAPGDYLRLRSARGIRADLRGFRHRFTTEEDVAGLLAAMRRALLEHSSLGSHFMPHLRRSDDTILPALGRWLETLGVPRRPGAFGLLPTPRDGSACKRLLLFLRWMGRRDRVDPGAWIDLAPEPRFLAARLVVPVDTHMYRVGKILGFTRRAQPDLAAALEITEGFRRIAPRDPTRYDFALTRLGMSRTLDALR